MKFVELIEGIWKCQILHTHKKIDQVLIKFTQAGNKRIKITANYEYFSDKNRFMTPTLARWIRTKWNKNISINESDEMIL